MPRSKAELRWAYAHKDDKGKDGDYAREVIAKFHGHHMSELPERAKKKGNKAAVRKARGRRR